MDPFTYDENDPIPVEELLVDYLLDELDEEARARVEERLAHDADLALRLEDVSATLGLLANEPAQPALTADRRALVMAALGGWLLRPARDPQHPTAAL